MARLVWSKVKSRRCAVCWGPVVLRGYSDPSRPGEVDWRVECPRGCSPGGHISEWSVDRQRADDLGMWLKVVANYPELDTRERPTAEQLADITRALYGPGGQTSNAHQGTD